jgi:hydroxymethylpyrimidine pyrophosphatase-like HAD family hydrolase
MKKKVLSVDFDGVIRNNMTDQPMEGVQKALKWLKNKGYMVVVCTGRDDLDKVEQWLKRNGMMYKPTNNKVKAQAYIDDRAIRFINWPDTLNYF